jgi:hypothetical protein
MAPLGISDSLLIFEILAIAGSYQNDSVPYPNSGCAETFDNTYNSNSCIASILNLAGYDGTHLIIACRVGTLEPTNLYNLDNDGSHQNVGGAQ